MKRFLLIIAIFFAASFELSAQYYSRVKPILVVWQVDGQKVSLRKGLYGISKPPVLKISFYFDQRQAKLYTQKKVILQFRWYYYLSTRRKLVKVENVPFSKGEVNPDGSYTITSVLRTVQPGWWEVQVVSSLDRRYLRFANLDRYQILIQPNSYTMR